MLSPLWEMDLSPKGVGSAFMTQAPGPGSFPAPRLLTQDAFPPYAREQGQGPSCGHKDKHILVGRNHFLLMSLILGELTSHFVYASRKENFLFVKKKKALQTARWPLDIKVFLQNSILMA